MLVNIVHWNLQLWELQIMKQINAQFTENAHLGCVCLQQLNWRHTNYYLAGTTVKNTNNLRLSDMTGMGKKLNNFRFQCNRSNFFLVPFQLWINELERLRWKWKHFKLHMSTSKNKHTVRIVGVTKAQQSLQNRFGWKPIIISMSSQNLCRPAKKEQNRNEIKEEKWERLRQKRHGEWPGFNKVP